MKRLIVACLVLFGIFAAIASVRVETPPREQNAVAKTAARAAEPTVAMVGDGPEFSSAFTILPDMIVRTTTEQIKRADDVIRRFAKWKARPNEDIVTVGDFRNARSALSTVKQTEPEFAAAKAKAGELDALGPELAKAERDWADRIRARNKVREAKVLLDDAPGRRQHAKTVEEDFLRAYMDAKVTTEGEKDTTLRLKYIGFSRVAMFKWQEDGKIIRQVLSAARARGFRKVIFADGYQYSWTWDLTKE